MAADTRSTIGDHAAPVSAGRVGVALRARLRGISGLTLLSGALMLGGVVMGAIIAADWNAQPVSDLQATAPVTRQSGREMVAGTIRRLEQQQADLKLQIADLRAQINLVQQDSSTSRGSLLDIHQELERQRLASGLVPIEGAGIVATLNDSGIRAIPEGNDPANYIVHEYDLRDVLNTLWAAGAEAVSLNGERIVGNTSIYCVGTTVICNATRLSPPYMVSAIGDPDTLAAALRSSFQMAKFNRRAEQYGLPFTIEERPDLSLPAYSGSFVFNHATVEK